MADIHTMTKTKRRLRPRFSLRSLLLLVFLAGSSFGLWLRWKPFRILHSFNSPFSYGAMLSLEGDRILTRGTQSIQAWDVSSYERVAEINFSQSSSPIEWWSLSPDGSTLAVVFPKEIQLVDWKARTILRHLRTTASLTRNVMFSGDGSTLACVDNKSSVHIWDVSSGQKQNTLASPDFALPTEDAHSGYVTFVALSNSGKLVLTLVQNYDRLSPAGYEWKWRLFDLGDGSLRTFPNADWEFGVFSPDEKYFVESSGKIRYVKDGSMVRFGPAPNALCFVPGSSDFDWHIDHQANDYFWNGIRRSTGDPLNNRYIRHRTMSNDRLLFTGYSGRPPEVLKRNWPYPSWGRLGLPEFWLTVVFSFGLIGSLIRDYRRIGTPKVDSKGGCNGDR